MKPTAPLPGGDAVRTVSRNGHHSPDVYGPSGRSPWLDVDWREHQRWMSVDGQPVNTIDLGDGPPLVFVHGLTGSWPNWLEQLPVFAREHRVVAMDLPGFGHSPMPHERITISFYARTARRAARRASDRHGGTRRQLDGRVRLRRAGDRVPGARRAPRARLRRRPEHLPEPVYDACAVHVAPIRADSRRVHDLGSGQRGHHRPPTQAAQGDLRRPAHPSQPAGSSTGGRAGARRGQARLRRGARGASPPTPSATVCPRSRVRR